LRRLGTGRANLEANGARQLCRSLNGGGSWYRCKRYLYWHLSWTKADGARLDMLAHFKQDYESVSGWQQPGAASLERLDIRPAPAR
jgi:hypothetical protein